MGGNEPSWKIARNLVFEKLKERGYKIIEENGVIVKSPSGVNFLLKITSLKKRNAWIIPPPQNSYYVLVFKPEADSPTFFILKPEEMQRELESHQSSMRRPVSEYSNPELERKGLNFQQPFPYEDKWDSLPE